MNKIQIRIRVEPVNTYGKHCKEKIAWISRLIIYMLYGPWIQLPS